jgi:hypothetical protein
MQASARVMRSYDYCHFEIVLGDECPTLDAVDDLRKQAAILVDEAVRQYKIAKQKENSRQMREDDIERSLQRIELIKKTPISEWSIEQAALMRSYEDKSFWASMDADGYDYNDGYNPDRDHHFSMLTRFKNNRISAATAGKKSHKGKLKK